jgi:hypothetical protein
MLVVESGIAQGSTLGIQQQPSDSFGSDALIENEHEDEYEHD